MAVNIFITTKVGAIENFLEKLSLLLQKILVALWKNNHLVDDYKKNNIKK